MFYYLLSMISQTRGPYPNPDYWSDSSVYINATFPLNPPSVGVATFDALDKYGLLYYYPDSMMDSISHCYPADTLTSRPIALEYPGRNDIYLSFFYEPRDVSGSPYPNDSLLLDFYAPDSARWFTVWAVPGDTANKAVYFKQVLIPVSDAKYLRYGFRFRFRNYISPSNPDDPDQIGNAEYWHIDYVRLDTGRNSSDTIIHDVAFLFPPPSMLTPYQAMPESQFLNGFSTVLDSAETVIIRNNDDSLHSVTLSFATRNTYYPSKVTTFTGGNLVLQPHTTFAWSTNLINPFDFYNADLSIIELKSFFTTDAGQLDYWNDTVRFDQIFKNYLAMDDGSAERGYGLDGGGTENALGALSFTAYAADTLTGISILFNPTFHDTTLVQTFNLAVWSDSHGSPGRMIYEKQNEDTVKYGPFPIYPLDASIIVSGTFYVGWVQQSENSLNMGFDLNNDNHQYLFLNLGNGWFNSSISGTLMIRPVFEKINRAFLSNKVSLQEQINVFPNPASTIVHISVPQENYPIYCSFYSMTGKIIWQQELTSDSDIPVNEFPNGMYIISCRDNKVAYPAVKLLIEH